MKTYNSNLIGRVMLSTAFKTKYAISMLDGIEPGQEEALARQLRKLPDPDMFERAAVNTKCRFDSADDVMRHMIKHIGRHIPAVKWIMDQRQMEAYIAAYAGAYDSGSEEIFFTLDSGRLLPCMEDPYRMYYSFLMLPYFDRPEYIFHVLTNGQWKWFANLYIDNRDVLKLAANADFRKSRILSGRPAHAETLISVCHKNGEAYRYLAYIAQLSFKGIGSTETSGWYSGLENLEDLKDAGPCMAILELVKGNAESVKKLITLMDMASYQKKMVRTILYRLTNDTEESFRAIRSLSGCMLAAWFLKREDVLAFREACWWKADEDAGEDMQCGQAGAIILNAMLKKQNVLLSALAEAKEGDLWHDLLLYLSSCRQKKLNLNLFNKEQLRKAYEMNLLDVEIPEWIHETTFDVLKTLKLIGLHAEENKDVFLGIYKKLAGNMRMEPASRRMTQMLHAVGGSDVSYIKDCADRIAENLCQHDLYSWRSRIFCYAADGGLVVWSIGHPDAWDTLKKTRKEREARFVIRNYEALRSCGYDYETLMDNFLEKDQGVRKIREFLGLEPAFYEKYRESCTEFFLENTDIAVAYLQNSRAEENKSVMDNFRLILKAALCGKLKDLKYHSGDLSRETGFPFSSKIASTWETDLCRNGADGTSGIREDSSFGGIMKMGVEPITTCMNYFGGLYSYCLLSYFDANKKIVYRTDEDGNVAGRAVIRLTKASNTDRSKYHVNFADVEEAGSAKDAETGTSYPVLFLEHLYTAYQGKKLEKLEREFIEFAKEKADQMGIRLLVSTTYQTYSMETKQFSVYITKSKNGYQYLDSFGGEHTRSNDAHYQYANCFVFPEQTA